MDITDDLPAVFRDAERTYSAIRDDDHPVPQLVHDSMRQFLHVGDLIRQQAVFSVNEELEDIDTESLRYLLAAAYLGDLVLKLQDQERRAAHLDAAEEFLSAFLGQCRSLGLLTPDDELVLNNRESEDAIKRREQKIARFKREKQANERIKVLTAQVEHELDRETLDREHVLALLNVWVHRSCGHLSFARQERDLLQHAEKLKAEHGGEVPPPPSPRPTKGIRPFVLTREMVKVFGAGYPSLPSLTVEQAAEREHAMGLHNCSSDNHDTKMVQRNLIEEDTVRGYEAHEAQTYKDRAWAVYKEENPYGAGNRHNKS